MPTEMAPSGRCSADPSGRTSRFPSPRSGRVGATSRDRRSESACRPTRRASSRCSSPTDSTVPLIQTRSCWCSTRGRSRRALTIASKSHGLPARADRLRAPDRLRLERRPGGIHQRRRLRAGFVCAGLPAPEIRRAFHRALLAQGWRADNGGFGFINLREGRHAFDRELRQREGGGERLSLGGRVALLFCSLGG